MGRPERRGAVIRFDHRGARPSQEALGFEWQRRGVLHAGVAARQGMAQELVCRLAGAWATAIHLRLFDSAGAGSTEEAMGFGHSVLLMLEFLFALDAARRRVAGRSGAEIKHIID